MKRIATSLLVLATVAAMSPIGSAQTVETVLTSPLIQDYLALDKSNGDLYVSNYAQVSRISPDGSIEMLTEGYQLVTGMGVSEAGDLYFNDTVGDRIYRRQASGSVAVLVTSLDDPIGLWMSPNNDGFYTQTQEGSVYFVTFGGTVTALYTGLGGRITDITLDDDGNIYLAYFDFGSIKKITPDGVISDFATIPGWISYITYGSGQLYATGWQSHQVHRIDLATGVSEVIAGTGEKGVADGDALTEAQFNIPNGLVTSVTGDTLYVTSFRSKSLRRIVLNTTTDIAEADEVPEEFELGQNYPNPFNPVTAIPFTVREASHVKLSVFDIRGQEVATLVNGLLTSGEYSLTWAGDNQPSGVYIYRLDTGRATMTRRMVLLK